MSSFQQQNLYVNPNIAHALATNEAVRYQNEGLALDSKGDFVGAERCFLRAIEIRNQAFGVGNNYIALNQNSLGELYIKMNRLDEAEAILQSALKTRTKMKNTFDAAATRESLAQLYEAKADAEAAHEMRMRGAPQSLVCGNQKVNPVCLHAEKSVQDLSISVLDCSSLSSSFSDAQGARYVSSL